MTIPPYWYIIVIPAIMFSILGGLALYGHFGEHRTYNETITVSGRGYADGDPCIIDQNGRWIEYNVKTTWKEWLNIEPGNSMNVQIRENVYGDKEIIKVW